MENMSDVHVGTTVLEPFVTLLERPRLGYCYSKLESECL